MIISASRRTDIPAFYAEWFSNRVRAGYCTVPNPFNRRQISRVSLHPEDVEAIVFWTRHPRPLFPYLDELDRRGFRYYFQFTLIGYPREIDPKSPDRAAAIAAFRELADRIGPERVIWRYDPIVFSQLTGLQYHAENYAQIAASLRGATSRSVISIMDFYPKIRKRLEALRAQGVDVVPEEGHPQLEALLSTLADSAAQNGMQTQSCAEELDLTGCGILPGSCVDAKYIEATFGFRVKRRKDPSQRPACSCVVSKDIGMYDSCLFGCQYCYATSSFNQAQANYTQHDSQSPSLLGWYDPEKKEERI